MSHDLDGNHMAFLHKSILHTSAKYGFVDWSICRESEASRFTCDL
jgi:hypothetical protein